MRPGSIFAWSRASIADKAPARERISESTLGDWGAICCTTKMLAGNLFGNALTSVRSASTPPAEDPITMMSLCITLLSAEELRESSTREKGRGDGQDFRDRQERFRACHTITLNRAFDLSRWLDCTVQAGLVSTTL